MFSILPLYLEIASWWERKNKEIKRQRNSIGASILIIKTIKSWHSTCGTGEATVKLRLGPWGCPCAPRAENPALKLLLLSDLVTNSLPISCFSRLCPSACISQPRRHFTRAWKLCYIFLPISPAVLGTGMWYYYSLNVKYYRFSHSDSRKYVSK